jgi:predicted amidophosphoribosyltransferase
MGDRIWLNYKKIDRKHPNRAIRIITSMTETICRSCGSELDITLICGFCNQALKFGCENCGHITDEKVHVDCRNAEFLSRN